MTTAAGVARAVRLAPTRTCRDCECYPCRCATPGSGMAPFALRIEPCACGGTAIAGGGTAANVMAAVQRHNETFTHQQWRARRERG